MSDNAPAKKATKKATSKKAPAKKAADQAPEQEPAAAEQAEPAEQPKQEAPKQEAPKQEAPKSEPTPKKEKKPRRGPSAKQAVNVTRNQIGKAVRLVCLLAAAFLALGVLLVALRHNVNADNPVVEFVTKVADVVDGPFSRQDGILKFGGDNAMTKNALVNWGLAAIIWLVIGQLASRLIRR